jgi:hypothetical protein
MAPHAEQLNATRKLWCAVGACLARSAPNKLLAMPAQPHLHELVFQGQLRRIEQGGGRMRLIEGAEQVRNGAQVRVGSADRISGRWRSRDRVGVGRVLESH